MPADFLSYQERQRYQAIPADLTPTFLMGSSAVSVRLVCLKSFR